eukprot:gene6660-4802_t
MLDAVAVCEAMTAALEALGLPPAASDRRHLKTATIKGGDLTPVYAVVGAFVFALLLYGCRRVCRRVCPTGELLMRTLDVEDIELELDEEAEPLRDPEAASKMLTRPGMIAGTGKRAAKQLLAKSSGSAYAQQRDDGLELERFLDHSDVASVAATPQRHLSPVRYTPAKAAHGATPSTPGAASEPAAAEDADDADDMWRLWNKTYDHRNTITDPAPAAAPPSQSQKAYQSIKFRRADGSAAPANAASSTAAAAVTSPAAPTALSPYRGHSDGPTSPALHSSPSRHNLPRLDLSPIHDAQLRRQPTAHNSSTAALVPLKPLQQLQQAASQKLAASARSNGSGGALARPPPTLSRPFARPAAPTASAAGPVVAAAKPPPPNRPPPGYYATPAAPATGAAGGPPAPPRGPPLRPTAAAAPPARSPPAAAPHLSPPPQRSPPRHPPRHPPQQRTPQPQPPRPSPSPAARRREEDDDDLSAISSVRTFDPDEL